MATTKKNSGAIPPDLRYAATHEWIRVEGSVGTVGITDHAQDCMREAREARGIYLVDLPAVGVLTRRAAECGTVESQKDAWSLYSPVTGRVTEINTELEDRPELIHEDPYGRGWMFKIEILDPDELAELMSAEAYKEFVGG